MILARSARRRACAALFGLLVTGVAWAGPAHVDSTGYAVGGRDVVAYFTLPATERPVAAVPGRAAFTTEWKGARYAFASAANRDAFIANPERYLPQFDGHCAWAAGEGYKAPASPNAWRIIGGKLYLNYSLDIHARWSSQTRSKINAGNAHWRKIGDQPAAIGDGEDYTPGDAPLR